MLQGERRGGESVLGGKLALLRETGGAAAHLDQFLTVMRAVLGCAEDDCIHDRKGAPMSAWHARLREWMADRGLLWKTQLVQPS
jgi:hypothetical protein